jgi:chemotaxis protein MotB
VGRDRTQFQPVVRQWRCDAQRQAFNIIDKVAAILKPFDNPIHVEGFTDNLPIRTAQYPTNWELSSARSASIVRMLAMQG